jgi:hypothetical protein
MLETYPLLFDETISCLAMILGETGNSGCNLGFYGEAKNREIQSNFRAILRDPRGLIPDSISAPIMGDFSAERLR